MKALFFGSIGSVIETSEMQRQAFNAAFKAHGLDWVWEKPDYAQMLKTSGGVGRIAEYATKTGDTVDAAAIHNAKSALFLDMLQAGDLTPRAGVVALLKQAEADGLKTAFVSTTEPATIKAIATLLQNQGAPDFDLITSRALGLAQKPAPDVYDHAAAQVGIAPRDILVIEDNLPGVSAAKAAGMQVVAFPGQFDDPNDFAAADHITTETLFDDSRALLDGKKAGA